MTKINIDFETRSAVDLINDSKKTGLAGLYNYASDPTTDVICVAYAIDEGEPELWTRGSGPIPDVFDDKRVTIHAWNADFEMAIWNSVMVDYGFKPIARERWRCSAFASRCNNMPQALGNAARCLGVKQQKQERGRELIKLLCLPLADGSFCEDPKLLEEMYEYCKQDVRTEIDVARQLREPTDEEWLDYHANCWINDRGVRIDRELCEAAQRYAKEEEADLIDRIQDVTDGAVVKARGEKLKAWVVDRLTEEQEKLLVKYRNGERKLSLDRYNRARLLAVEDIDPDVREVVECSDFAQKSSVSKFKSLARLADPDDDHVRGALMCNGAAASGRYSSKGAQVHNFPRDCMKNPLEVREDFMDRIMAEDIVDYFDKPIMTILSHMLRPALIPAEGSVFLVSDWSAIEGRVAPWLCGEDDKDAMAKLKLYAEGAPIYEITAAQTFRVPVEAIENPSRERQVGKVQELSFQYGGGSNAFLAMARGYGVTATVNEAESYKRAWRRNNPWAQRIWKKIEKAAMKALNNPGEMIPVGRLTYFCVDNILAGGQTLFCQLPCGRLLTYPDVRKRVKEGPNGPTTELTALRAAWTPKADEKEWPRSSLYGGLMYENVVQGAAGSLPRRAVRRCQTAKLPVVFHVHDELVIETPRSKAEKRKEQLWNIMNKGPLWAEGLPLKADVDVMERFGK